MKRKEIKQYKNNNNLDLEKIIEEYSGYVYKIIKNMANNYISQEDIEEIVLDTFFIVWKNREKIHDEALLSSYIAGITRNLIKEKTRIINIYSNIEDFENTIQDEIKIDMIYEQREKIELIETILKDMKQQDIEIFKLFYEAGKKISEIAVILGMSEFSIKSRLYRIRKKIKKEFSKRGYSNEE